MSKKPSGILGVVLNAIDLFDSVLTAIAKPVVFVLGMVIAVAFAGGVFFRSIVGTPVFGLEEIILLSVMWFYLIGAGLASSERSHLSADFIPLIFTNKKIVQAIALFATTISLVLSVFILLWSLDLFSWGVAKGQATSVFRVPWYISQFSLVVGSILFIVYLTRDFLHDLLVLIYGEEDDAQDADSSQSSQHCL
ncbi:TRAP transporter small permease [Ruegeria faecimaris]|uniref:TRAP transporter small permease protein n=1 Tax=Ruegeria faecimaris TaxID=686389 RepID=A0A521EFT0_9RHOB|nr:TRAP transporter small permease subunit [Ruegeria faecimaris]SMO82787.1 TRAP-type C4-dicarboxylate transport system, small permease component [Ruegeria faecimaris]